MLEENREFSASDLEGAVAYVRALGNRGATTVWIEVWTGRGWELSYGSDPGSCESQLLNGWGRAARLRIRAPGEARQPAR